MKLLIEAYHEIDGKRTDLAGFNYADGIEQKCIKEYEYGGMETEQETEDGNPDGLPYTIYAQGWNYHLFHIQIQVTEVDFFTKLEFHSNVYLTLENSVQHKVEYIVCELDQVDDTIYYATLKVATDSSIMTLRGNEL